MRQRPLPALGSGAEGLTRPGFSEKPGSQGAGAECLSFSYKDYKKIIYSINYYYYYFFNSISFLTLCLYSLVLTNKKQRVKFSGASCPLISLF